MGRFQRQNSMILQTRGDHRLSKIWNTIKSILFCIVESVRYLWKHNPIKVLTERQRRLYFVENYDGLVIKPKLRERMLDLFLTDFRRRKRLLQWVQTKLRTTEVHDFSTCWHDGTVLCALLESICPGVCPSFHLLSPLNMVKNCRLGIKLANKYLYVPMDLLTPEEMAIATKDTEFKIIQYISMIKWASQNIREKWTILHESLIAAKTGRCFAKGSGLRNGIVGRRSKFTIVVSDTIGVFNLLVEIRGPNNDYSGERIVSLHQAKGVLEKSSEGTRAWSDSVKYLEDCVGNTFVRKKVPSRFAADNQTDLMVLDFQSGEEGTFYVTFVPRRAGIHAVSVKWQNHHVENSPFRIKVYKATNVSTKSLKGAQEKRVIFDSLSLATIPGALEEEVEFTQSRNQQPGLEFGESPGSTISKSKAYSRGRQLTVTSRRVLRRIITRNGEDIVIEEAVSPTLSRQSSITDNSDDDRYSRRDRDDKRPSPKSHSTQNLTPVAPPKPTTSLGTVLEEKRNSRENMFKDINLSDIVSSPEFKQKLEEYHLKSTRRLVKDENETGRDKTGNGAIEPETEIIKSRGDPSIRYTCTELNEHNVLETFNGEKEAVQDDKEMVSSWFTLPEDDGRWMERNVVKRSSLKRSTSIKGLSKTTAHRTTSDGTIYSLRRRILSIAASDVSDSSEVSSDDRQSGNDDDYGVVVPSLKLLHSNSLKKACMYIGRSSYAKDDVIHGGKVHETFLEKSRVKATQSLPVLENAAVDQTDNKLHSKDLKSSEHLLNFIAAKSKEEPDYEKGSNSGVVKPTARIPISPDNHILYNPMDTHCTDTIDKSVDVKEKKSTEVLTASPDQIKTLDYVKAESRVISRHEQFINQNVYVNVLEDDSDLSEPTSSNHYHKTTLHTDIKPPSEKEKSLRGTLTRQWTVVCQRSSQSSSETGNDVSKNEEQQKSPANQNTDTPSSSSNANFKSIFVQSDAGTGTSVTQEVVIIVPKPKVDKQTQVCDKEITKETGWDIIEGVYLLLRRISVKVPCITTCPPSTGSQSSSDFNNAYGKIRKHGLSTGGSKSGSHYSKQPGTIDGSSGAPSESNQLQVPSTSDTERTGSDTSSFRASTAEGSFKVSDLSIVHTDDIKRNFDNEFSQKFSCTERIDPDFSDGRQARDIYPVDNPGCSNEPHDTFDDGGFKRHNFPGSGSFSSCGRDKHEAVNEWFRRNDHYLQIQHRQGTIETVDSGFDDNPATFNRHARFSLPTLRTANGHVKLHRRPYKGKIPLEPDLVNSFNSISLEKKDLGNEADDELLFNTSFEHRQNKTQRRRHKLEIREESVSFSDSEIDPNKQRRRRSIGISRRGKEMTSTLRPDDGVVEIEKNMKNDKPNRVDSIEVLKDDNKNLARDSEIDNHNKSKPPLKKEVVKKSSTTASSMDSNYCGFGVSKTNRSDFLSHIGQFQNLCKTEEVLDDNLSGISRASLNSSVNDKNGTVDDSKTLDRSNSRVSADITNEVNINEHIATNKVLTDTSDNKAAKMLKSNNLNNESNLDLSSQKNGTDAQIRLHLNSDSLTTVSDLSNLNYENGTIASISDVRSSNMDTNFIGDDSSDFGDLSYVDDQRDLSVQRLVQSQNGYIRNCLVLDPTLEDAHLDQGEGNAMIHVAGAGLHQSLVGANNSFQVWTEHLTTGSLSVNIFGPRPHTVTETSVLYTGDNLYEVSYGVTQPGLYRIHVKWADCDIPNSPFLCTAVLM